MTAQDAEVRGHQRLRFWGLVMVDGQAGPTDAEVAVQVAIPNVALRVARDYA